MDGKAKEDGAAFWVALFASKDCAIEAKSSWFGWAVTTKKSERNKGADSFKVVLSPEYMRKLEDKKLPILSSPYLETGSNKMEGLKNGRRLISLSSTPLRACVGKGQPQLLYRVVHEDHPGNGLRSRGFGTIKTDGISFMLHFEHHLDWKRRDASPFMSTTTSAAKAANLADRYEWKGCNNIEVLVIKVDENEWQAQSRIWHVRQTAASLGLVDVLLKPYYEDEYLIEDYIPASCVTRVRWEDMKADIKAETMETRQSKKRKRSVFESDDPEDEPVVGKARRKMVWGVVKTSRGYLLRDL